MSTRQFADMTAEQAAGFMPDAPPQPARAALARMIGPKATVIDVGCGRAEEIGDLYTPEQYTGTDCSPELVRLAAARWPGYTFEACAAQDLHARRRQLIGGRSFWDFAIIKAVLEHVPPDEAVRIYEEARKIARTLLVCWHWEPAGAERRTSYDGELGVMLQIRHRRDRFQGVLERTPVERHVIWRVQGGM